MTTRENSPARLTVCIVLFDSPLKLLRGTLISLQAAALRAMKDNLANDISVYLVDNSCSEVYSDSVEKLLWELEEGSCSISYCSLAANLGFGGGNNTVIRALDSDFHLILNPDVELAADAISTALLCLRSDPDVVLLSPHAVSGGGAQEFLCKRYPTITVLLVRAFAPGFISRFFRRRLEAYEMRDLCSGDTQAQVVLASGAFMLVRTQALQSVEGFDEGYFLYFEDFDLSLRLAHFGRLMFYPATKIVHHGGYTARKGSHHMRLFIRSGVRFFNTHGWRWI